MLLVTAKIVIETFQRNISLNKHNFDRTMRRSITEEVFHLCHTTCNVKHSKNKQIKPKIQFIMPAIFAQDID